MAAVTNAALTVNEMQLARLLATVLAAKALKRIDRKPVAITPTMRPDPQALAVTHGTLMSHENA